MPSTFQDFKNLELDVDVDVNELAGDATITIQFLDRGNGNEVGERVGIFWYLAADAGGDALATAPVGGVAISGDGLAVEWTNNLAGLLVSEVDGDIQLLISDSAGTKYLILVMPDGKLVSTAIVFT